MYRPAPPGIPVDRAVKVDVYVPGRPPDADTIYYIFSEILRTHSHRSHRCHALRLAEESEYGKHEYGSSGKKGKTIVVNPVTRIEGHGKITVQLTEDGAVDSARFHVTQYRGFEVFREGAGFPRNARHHPEDLRNLPGKPYLASAKACDAILGVTLTPSAAKLRRSTGQIIQSYASLLLPPVGSDLLFGFDADPAIRNVAGLAQEFPDLAVAGITMRKFGQEVIKTLAERKFTLAQHSRRGEPEPLPPGAGRHACRPART
ncbi:hypothetical protein MASR1M66_10670 [Aminivibrio sp.]